MAGAKPKTSSPFHSKPYSCSSLHSSTTGCPVGISRLESPGTALTRSLLDKLGMSDVKLQEQLRRWHEYAFNLGSGQLFDDYHKASSRLLQRNLPDIFYDKQQTAIFIPESDLPRVPRAVNVSKNSDIEDYERRKQDLDGPSADFLQIRPQGAEIQHLKGELLEKEMAEALKAEFQNPGIEVVVLQGPKFKTPDSPNHEEEHDFVVVLKRLKVIMCIESKRTLSTITFHEAAKQLDKIRALVNVYFGDQLKSGEWVFMGFIHYGEIHRKKINLCPACEKFALHKASQLHPKLAQAKEELLKKTRPVCTPCHEEYKAVVKDLVFNTLAQPINTKCRMNKAVYEKIVGKKAKKKGKDAVVGQGDVRSVLFWTTDQANLMLSHDPKFQFVAFVSCWRQICL